jgi:hypothetical protein
MLVDTSGFYALLVARDTGHLRAKSRVEQMQQAGLRACTTDYVVDETATLLKARGLRHLNQAFFTMLDQSEALVFYYIHEERFRKSRRYFERYADHDYSFTDCTSFVLMQEIGIRQALTKDNHFGEAGFDVLLPNG